MPSYTTSSREPSSVERKKLWNPSDTLGIFNTDPGYQCITCIGYAPSQRRRCRNPIRAGNREFIMRTLNEITYLSPDSAVVASRLRAIAGPALCVRYHQNQATTVIQDWQQKIREIKPQKEARSYPKPAQSTDSQYAEPDQALKEAQEQLREMKKMLAELQEELKGQRQQDQEHERQAKQNHERQRKEEARNREEREEREQEKRRKEEEQEKRRKEEEQQEKKRREEAAQKEKEHKERERRERENQERAQRAQERAAHNERIRQNAQKRREESERLEREKAQKERKEWDEGWTTYQERWIAFKATSRDMSEDGNIRDTIPWPVKLGRYSDVNASGVRKFFVNAPPRDGDRAKLMRKECTKWHPDMIRKWQRGAAKLSEVDQIMLDMICRVVTDLLNEAAGRSSDFLD